MLTHLKTTSCLKTPITLTRFFKILMSVLQLVPAIRKESVRMYSDRLFANAVRDIRETVSIAKVKLNWVYFEIVNILFAFSRPVCIQFVSVLFIAKMTRVPRKKALMLGHVKHSPLTRSIRPNFYATQIWLIFFEIVNC